jgi:hypothetical protein
VGRRMPGGVVEYVMAPRFRLISSLGQHRYRIMPAAERERCGQFVRARRPSLVSSQAPPRQHCGGGLRLGRFCSIDVDRLHDLSLSLLSSDKSMMTRARLMMHLTRCQYRLHCRRCPG